MVYLMVNTKQVLTGLDAEERNGFSVLRGKRVAVVTNHTSLDRKWGWLPRLLKKYGVGLAKIFSPEHGPYGVAKEGEEVTGYFDRQLGCDVVSLYGERKTLLPDDIDDVDAVVYDIQDAGVRFYTYISTLNSTVKACRLASRQLIVLDRPDPLNGNTVRGPVLDEELLSFVGIDAIPLQYGMTPGELANYWSGGMDFLEVVRMKNWSRGMWLDDTQLPFAAPSPNLPDIQSLLLYPGLAVFEGLNVSVGRGTTRPFRLIGAPWLDGYDLLSSVEGVRGFIARYTRFRPWYSKFENEVCEGVEIMVTDREKADPIRLSLRMLSYLSGQEGVEWTQNGRHLWAEYITGVKGIDRIAREGDAQNWVAKWNRDARAFRKRISKCLLYR